MGTNECKSTSSRSELDMANRRVQPSYLLYAVILVILLLCASYVLNKTWTRTSGSPLPVPVTDKCECETQIKSNDATKSISSKSDVSGNQSGPLPRVRVMCMVLTTQKNWIVKAKAVRATWGKRCDVTRYYYSPVPGEPLINNSLAVPLYTKEDYAELTTKVTHMFGHAYKEFNSRVDWFFKADDDTYVIVENLRRLVGSRDPEKPYYVGHRSMDIVKHGYNGGGAGYLLSRAAMKLMVVDGEGKGCRTAGGFEDVEVGTCLEKFGVYPESTLDSRGLMRFHFSHPMKLFTNSGDARQVMFYAKEGDDFTIGNKNAQHHVMSPDMITFHHMDSGYMFMYDFFLYDLRRDDNKN